MLTDDLILKSWALKQENAYWLVTADVHRQAIKQNHQHAFSDSAIIFYDEAFKDVMSLSPWLIPIQESSFSNIDEAMFSQGMVICSKDSMWNVMLHLRSLLHAGLNGEEVLFRFYDHSVLAPMLVNYQPQELNQFLGNINQLALIQDDELMVYSNTSMLPYQARTAPWWKILPHHLDGQYDIREHAKNIERYFWEKLPQQMSQFDNGLEKIHRLLEVIESKNIEFEYKEHYLLAGLMEPMQLDYPVLKKQLLLMDDEITQLDTIHKEVKLWACC